MFAIVVILICHFNCLKGYVDHNIVKRQTDLKVNGNDFDTKSLATHFGNLAGTIISNLQQGKPINVDISIHVDKHRNNASLSNYPNHSGLQNVPAPNLTWQTEPFDVGHNEESRYNYGFSGYRPPPPPSSYDFAWPWSPGPSGFQSSGPFQDPGSAYPGYRPPPPPPPPPPPHHHQQSSPEFGHPPPPPYHHPQSPPEFGHPPPPPPPPYHHPQSPPGFGHSPPPPPHNAPTAFGSPQMPGNFPPSNHHEFDRFGPPPDRPDFKPHHMFQHFSPPNQLSFFSTPPVSPDFNQPPQIHERPDIENSNSSFPNLKPTSIEANEDEDKKKIAGYLNGTFPIILLDESEIRK